jgi:hypothetical protein
MEWQRLVAQSAKQHRHLAFQAALPSTRHHKGTTMPLTDTETTSLLAVKGVGKTVLQRLQQMGLDDVAKLAAANPADILQQGAAITGSSCWKNSPQAKAAITAAVAWAQAQQGNKAA